jgi:hypothetical protein
VPKAGDVSTAAAPLAAPIANQDDSGHVVDPNEELDLPPLSDLDALLEELGVQDIDAAPDAHLSGLSGGDDLDAMPSPGPAAPGPAARGKTGESGVSSSSKTSPAQSEVDLAAVAAGVAAAKAKSEPEPELDLTAIFDEPAKAASVPVPPAPKVPNEPDSVDGIDLNELDALLDSVLSAAPKPAPAPAPGPSAPAFAAPGEVDVEALQNEIAALKAELADLKGNIDKYAAAAAARVIREEIAVLAANIE